MLGESQQILVVAAPVQFAASAQELQQHATFGGGIIGGTAREDFEPAPLRPPRTHAAVDEFLARNRGRMGE